MTDLRPPSTALRLAEYPRALWTAAEWLRARPLLNGAPRGDGPVMVLPGLFNSDVSAAVMRRELRRLGYDAHGWGLGRNLGLRTIGTDGARLLARVDALADATGRPVALVGISLGGIMARFAAHRRPDRVAQVVTVSAPFAGSVKATNIWRTFEWVTGEKVDSPAITALLAECRAPLAVPATAIWSASDGLVNGRLCRDDACAAVEVRSGHLWVQFKPAVLRAVADALADKAGSD